MADEPRDDSGESEDRAAPRASISAELVALADDIDDTSVPSGELPELPRGSVIGRYTVLGLLQETPIDVLYGAYDPDTERKVAIRLIRVTETDNDVDEDAARQRMLVEAESLARIDHPCVVRVLEVGVLRGWIYLAMEFLDGIDLRKWMEARDDPFPWPEVLRVFREAGRGLAVAHKAGIVHRDFKPRSVLLCKGGRICVLDFGLGRQAAEDPSDDIDVSELKHSFPGEVVARDDRPASITRGGATLGTPHYMAPEVHITHRADAQSDQFSFCVALYEALYGERPFGGSRPIAIAMQAVKHNVRAAPPGSNVPEWLRKAVLRGLHPRPEERWPSMEALLRELARDPAASRRRWAIGGLLLAGLGGAAFGVVRQIEAERSSCAPDESALVGTWDPARREALHSKLVGSGRPWAAQTWETLSDGIDRWVNEWNELQEAACVATRIRGDANETIYQLRLDCLQRELAQIDAIGAVLERGDATIVDGAHGMVTGLRSPRWCTYTDDLTGRPVAPDDQREAIETLQRDLLELEASVNAGAQETLARSEALLGAVTPLQFAPLHVDAMLLAARAHREQGQLADAEDALHRAAAAATRAGLERQIAEAWIDLATIVAARGRPDEARRHADYAGAIIERRQYDRLQPALAEARGDVAVAAGRLADGLSHYYRAIELETRRDDGHPLRRVPRWRKLGRLLSTRGDHEAAERRFGDALMIQQQALGPRHPALGETLRELAEAQRNAGHLEGALETMMRVVEIVDDRPIEHAQMLVRIADVEAELDRLDEALAHYTRAETLLEGIGPATDALLADALLGRGRVMLARGDATAAIDPLRRAVGLREAAGDPLRLAAARFALARALWIEPASHASAIELAHAARQGYESADVTELAAVQRWLAEREGPAVQ